MYYTHWTRLICTGVIPFICLSAMNLLINKKLKNSPFQTQPDKIAQQKRLKTIHSSAKTLTSIVILYLVCNVPR
jgi:hypothetical protein